MKKKAGKHYSLLGLALLTASAIITNFARSESTANQLNSLNNGTLRQYSGGDGPYLQIYSCVTLVAFANCHATKTLNNVSGTSWDANNDTIMITVHGRMYTTARNTSLSILGNGKDTTSMLIQL
ncbi:hypothetical protein HHL16_18980 [Pseudoflavitalea sp. G-6-1-2]|uniref:hypothetical protein n=1 Tax=Pseudoflavitalea sp. G-6-1-2 TaxID=2728841 RepID=UPI00146B883B|nr:hypothetical protein [Pseudoflavitalea sp. G-6-1-2]NML22969.1 hypothetical protein [Pseudoflavitalea sp. G-6-1-2]